MTPAARLRQIAAELLALADSLDQGGDGLDGLLSDAIERRISVKEFAFQLGVSERHGYRLLTGRRRPVAKMSGSPTGATAPSSSRKDTP